MKMKIKSKSHDYEVSLSESLQNSIQEVIPSRKPFFLIDKIVFEIYKKQIEPFIQNDNLILVEANEYEKSLEGIGKYFISLVEKGFKKNNTLIVIGGGVLQDIGCFLASVYCRGVEWCLIPTTLLSQCDSCIGSKSSLNLAKYKNQLGTFYPPHQISIPLDVLKSLKADDIRSGIGEALKIALIHDKPSFDKLLAGLEEYKENQQMIDKIIWNSLTIKKVYIEQDEFDKGIRNILNYGHTFGHAFESVTNYKLPHGLAVLIGVHAAHFFSEQLGMIPSGTFKEFGKILEPYFNPYQSHLKSASIEDILKAMKSDKKNTSDQISFILTKGIGKMEKVPLTIEKTRELLKNFIEVL